MVGYFLPNHKLRVEELIHILMEKIIIDSTTVRELLFKEVSSLRQYIHSKEYKMMPGKARVTRIDSIKSELFPIALAKGAVNTDTSEAMWILSLL